MGINTGEYMAQQIMIIGMGQFGMALARALVKKGVEVLAVDSNKSLVDDAATFATEALVVDATDEAELARLDPNKRDAVVCAIGDDSKESSIICTALLRQLGAPFIIARANSKTHQRILHLVGAHQVVNPEQEFGQRFAHRILLRNVIADTSIADGLQLTELRIQPGMIGKDLVELALPKRFGVMVVAIRRNGVQETFLPSPHEKLRENDVLVVVSSETAITKLVAGV